jgi:hypothetical protein
MSRKQIDKFVAELASFGCEIKNTKSTFSAYFEGAKCMSAVSPTGAKWSVMVSPLIASQFNLTMW